MPLVHLYAAACSSFIKDCFRNVRPALSSAVRAQAPVASIAADSMKEALTRNILPVGATAAVARPCSQKCLT